MHPVGRRAVHRGGLRGHPRPGPWLHRPGGARRRQARRRSASCSTPGWSTGTRWITGANEPGRHVFDLVAGRDFTGDGTIEAASVFEGDPCPNGDGGTLVTARGIEMGHIFQLGRKFAEALDLKVLDENGKQVVVTMGSYGIGPSRAVAAIAEATLRRHRARAGRARWRRPTCTSWPTGKDDAVFEAAQALSDELVAQGLTVLYDDRRGVSPGVKFKDAELLGMPTIVVVGKGLADGVVEVRDRRTGEREDVAVADAAATRRPALLARDGGRGRRLRLGRHPHAVAHDRPA